MENLESNISTATEYLKEAIRQKNDAVAMFNLAHIYLYENSSISNID